MKQKTRLMTPEENHRFQLVQAVAFEVSIEISDRFGDR